MAVSYKKLWHLLVDRDMKKEIWKEKLALLIIKSTSLLTIWMFQLRF